MDKAAHHHGEYVLTHKPDPRPEWNPALYDFTPADQFDVGGKYVTERTTRDGIDAPIVAVEWEASKERREKLAPSQLPDWLSISLFCCNPARGGR